MKRLIRKLRISIEFVQETCTANQMTWHQITFKNHESTIKTHFPIISCVFFCSFFFAHPFFIAFTLSTWHCGTTYLYFYRYWLLNAFDSSISSESIVASASFFLPLPICSLLYTFPSSSSPPLRLSVILSLYWNMRGRWRRRNPTPIFVLLVSSASFPLLSPLPHFYSSTSSLRFLFIRSNCDCSVCIALIVLFALRKPAAPYCI